MKRMFQPFNHEGAALDFLTGLGLLLAALAIALLASYAAVG